MAWTDLNLITKSRQWVWWNINKLIDNCIWLKDNMSGASGDMTKAVYDTDDNSVVDAAETVTDGTTPNTSTAEEIRDVIDAIPDIESDITDLENSRIGFLEGYFKNDTPAVWGDRLLLLVGQVITIASYSPLCDAIYCGDSNNATAPAFYKTSDAGGTTRSTSGTYMVLPDARGLSWKGVGDAIINGRTKFGPNELGELQEDRLQKHNHATATGGTTQFWTLDKDSPTNDIAFGTSDVNADAQYYTGYLGCVGRSGSHTRDSSAGINWGIGY